LLLAVCVSTSVSTHTPLSPTHPLVASTPLTTPEEAKAFLQHMREKTHEREFSHQPPSNLNSAGMDAWFLQQKQREQELRERRREAEALLRGYRGGRESLGPTARGRESLASTAPAAGGWERSPVPSNDSNGSDAHSQKINVDTTGFPAANNNVPSLRSTTSGASDSLDDPRSFFKTPPAEIKEAPFIEEKKSAELRDALPHIHSGEDGSTFGAPPNGNATTATNNSEPPTVWLDFISSEPGAKFPPAAGRYHLYLSFACPGSHRALIVRALKGLEDVISVTYVHPTWRLTNPDDPTDKHRGWVFGSPDGESFTNTIQRGGPFPAAYPGNEPDPVFNAYSIRDIYNAAGDTAGKYTIPLLWDKETGTIVNNESSDIAYMLNSSFNDFCVHPELDLYTEYDQDGMAKLNEVSDWLSPLMIHGVYRCGFAKNQRAYDKAIAELCEAFDRADDILQTQRYLTGNDVLTDADIRLFCSLLRFDEVYSIYFKANARLVMLTPALLNFCREIYQMEGVADTCNMEQIKAHFFGSHAEWNKYSVIPRGLGFMELLDMPHDRYQLTDNNELLLEVVSDNNPEEGRSI